ncbi:MAG TPA: methyltransferase domain-containing protein [Candidatus Dojkabacteria bacterium]|nr:methyltransferase domain-containing protein [Candidatus Dojkabacteria bacterium]
MNLHPRNFYNPVKQKQRRYDKIVELLQLKPTDRVLNVGCGEGLTFEHFNKVNPIVGVDLFEKSKIEQDNFTYQQIKGDGTLPFKDQEFDAVVCIGVLEHVKPFEALQKTCAEIERVGKKFLILVPDYNTIIEPHYAFPFFQHLPIKIQEWLHGVLNLRLELDKRKDNPYEEINYYPTKKWLSLFKQGNALIHKHIGPFITNLIIWKS